MRLSIVLVVSSLSAIAYADTTPRECIAHNEKSIQLRADHKLQESREELLQCALPACPGEIRAECEKRLAVVNAGLPSVVLSAKDPAGGDLGWLARGELDAAFERPLLQLQKGQVTVPIRSGSAYHLLKLDDREELTAD